MLKRHRIELVCFDFWQTLFSSNRAASIARHQSRVAAFVAAFEGRPAVPAAEAVSRTMQAEWAHYNHVHLTEQRTPSNRERVAWIAAELGLPPPPEAALPVLLDALEESLFVQPPHLVAGMAELIERLHPMVGLAVISDTSYSSGRTLRRLLARQRLLDYFPVTTFSDEVGRSKPHPVVFEHTLRAAGIAPEHALLIGDREETDVAGAKAAGMVAVRFLGASRDLQDGDAARDTRADYVARSVDELWTLFGLSEAG